MLTEIYCTSRLFHQMQKYFVVKIVELKVRGIIVQPPDFSCELLGNFVQNLWKIVHLEVVNHIAGRLQKEMRIIVITNYFQMHKTDSR
jgi:hypothetical protein